MTKQFLLLASLVLLMTACSKDEDNPDCQRDDWIGVYTGTSDCEDDDNDESFDQVMVTAGAGENEIIVDVGDGDPTTVVVTGCEIPEEVLEFEFFGIEFTITSSGRLEGDNIILNIKTETYVPPFDNEPEQRSEDNCVVTYTK